MPARCLTCAAEFQMDAGDANMCPDCGEADLELSQEPFPDNQNDAIVQIEIDDETERRIDDGAAIRLDVLQDRMDVLEKRFLDRAMANIIDIQYSTGLYRTVEMDGTMDCPDRRYKFAFVLKPLEDDETVMLDADR